MTQFLTTQFTPLVCINRVDETADSATFEFKHIDDRPFEYQAGQFLTFEVEVSGVKEYRAYSMSSDPTASESASVTIKRVEGGKVSNHLLDHLQAGMAIPAMPAAGEFTIEQCQSTSDILFMSAGSGITPCLSMARWLLSSKQQVSINFVYSARSSQDIIMAELLNRLAAEHANFNLHFILESNTVMNAIEGRLNAENFAQLIPDVNGKTIFTCGPAAYMDSVKVLAEQRGFDMSLFHQESFTPDEKSEDISDAVNYQLFAPQYGKSGQASSAESLLSAMENARIPIVGACRTGVCGSCKCKVTGEVESTSQSTLTPVDIEQGYVLACSSKAKSDLVVEL